MYCKRCGMKLSDSATYCPNCKMFFSQMPEYRESSLKSESSAFQITALLERDALHKAEHKSQSSPDITFEPSDNSEEIVQSNADAENYDSEYDYDDYDDVPYNESKSEVYEEAEDSSNEQMESKEKQGVFRRVFNNRRNTILIIGEALIILLAVFLIVWFLVARNSDAGVEDSVVIEWGTSYGEVVTTTTKEITEAAADEETVTTEDTAEATEEETDDSSDASSTTTTINTDNFPSYHGTTTVVTTTKVTTVTVAQTTAVKTTTTKATTTTTTIITTTTTTYEMIELTEDKLLYADSSLLGMSAQTLVDTLSISSLSTTEFTGWGTDLWVATCDYQGVTVQFYFQNDQLVVIGYDITGTNYDGSVKDGANKQYGNFISDTDGTTIYSVSDNVKFMLVSDTDNNCYHQWYVFEGITGYPNEET